MPRVHFTVSQIRVAAACPRIFYFDIADTRRRKLRAPAVTRIWKSGGEVTACGTLFHATVERFNAQAARDPVVRNLLGAESDAEAVAAGLVNHIYWNVLNRDALQEKTGAQQQAFMTALRVYVRELADILAHARTLGKPLDEVLDQLFGDRRRRVDVTFRVGPASEEVHVTGELDYVFYDWRTEHHRILDYKLTPAGEGTQDLFQVSVYALMHHEMHKTQPDVGVLYLHPTRQMIAKSWEQVNADRHQVLGLLASMREWAVYEEQTGRGLKPPGDPVPCALCKWDAECERRLGPKNEGQRTPAAPPEQAHPVPPPEPPQVRPAASLWVGRTVPGGEPVGLPVQVLPTHLSVVGAAGSGKTWLAKVIAEETILQGVPVLTIDPQGDLVQFLRRTNTVDLGPDDDRRCQQYWTRVEPRIFTPGSSHGIRLCLSPLRLPRERELTALADPRRRAEELEAVLATVAGNLVSLAQAGGEVKSQETFVLQILRRLATGAEAQPPSLADVVAALSKPEALGLENPDTFVKKAERLKLARLLNNLLHGTAAGLFAGGVSLDLDRLCRPTQPGRVPLNVIYLNALADDRQKQYFVAALATEVYRWMVTTGSDSAAARLLFYLDEARDYIPAGGSVPPAKNPLIRLFAQGRKYGVACLICTQSPRSVDYKVFGNCSTKLIGRLESAQDVDRVADWFAVQGPAPAWLRGRQGADKGTFVARWPEMPPERDGQTFKSRPLYSLHEGAWAPDRVEQELRDDPVRRAWSTEDEPDT